LPVFVERQHVEVGDVVGVCRLQSSLALGFCDEIADVLVDKVALKVNAVTVHHPANLRIDFNSIHAAHISSIC